MKLVWNLVRKASSCCRRERPLNGKRMHPSVVEDQNEISQTQDTTNVVLETMEADVLNNKLPPLVESQTVIVLDGEDHFNGQSQALSKMEVDKQVETKANGVSQDEPADKKSETSNRNVGDKKNNSDVEATSAGDGAAGFSSEDSENDDHDLEGEHPQKKRKLNTDGVLEEDRITQEWDNDMKLIKRNLGRISRLFEVYDGYRDKKKPLTINSDLIIHESVIDGKNTPAGNSLELAKLQASLVSLPSPTKILGRQQLLDSFKQVTEGMKMPESAGKTSAKRSVSYEQIIDVSRLT